MLVTAERSEPARGWVLYDGQCGFCVRWLRLWRGTLERRGYGVDELQAPWVAQRVRVPIEELLHDIRLLEADDTIVSGADAYLDVMRHIWWAWPFYRIFSLPGFNAIAHAGYRWFARNRYCISGQCRIDR
jgi:predicted DCC family thiol-disulfide oxidoreductase YuxK